MAEEMINIDIKQFTLLGGLTDEDCFLIAPDESSNGRITLRLLKSIISADIKPSIVNGKWYIGTANTYVDAAGKTPEFRKTQSGIQYKYTTEYDSAWRTLITFADLKFRFEELTPEQLSQLKLTLKDLSPDDIAQLQQPARDMIVQLTATDRSIKDAEALRVSAEKERVLSEKNRKTAEQDRETEFDRLKTAAETAEQERETEFDRLKTAAETAEQERETEFDRLKTAAETATQNAQDSAKDADAAAKEALHLPKIENGTWRVWDIEGQQYVDSNVSATSRSPKIENGTWWVWDDAAGSYRDTGQSVNSNFTLTKEGVESVLTGNIETHTHEHLLLGAVVLENAPTENTLEWEDKYGTHAFTPGNLARVPDKESEQGYTFWQLYDISNGKAMWAKSGSGGSADLREKVSITLTSNQAQPDNALKGAAISVKGADGSTIEEAVWQGKAVVVRVPPMTDYTVSVSQVEGYSKPDDQSYTSVIQGERQLSFAYNCCLLSVNINSNQSTHTDLADATATVSYGSRQTTVKDGESVRVPLGTEVTVTALSVDRYQTPSVQRITPQSASQTVTLTYNTCVLTVQVSGLEQDEPVTASVKYGSVTEQVQPGASVKVPYGVSVTVSVSDVVGYSKPKDVVFTPDQPAHTTSFEYLTSAVRVTIDSNQPDKAAIAAVKATLSYAGHTEQIASGQTVSIPIGKLITISLPEVEGFRKPDDTSFINDGGLVERAFTYYAEKVMVLLTADAGTSLKGQKVTINGAVHIWNGLYIWTLIPFGTAYSVSVDAKSGYITPATQHFTASESSRYVTMQYIYNPIKKGYFMLDDSVSDPATKVTLTPEVTEVIKWIRANSHRVLARKTAEGRCRVIRLMDNDTTKYLDGQTAPIESTDYDVMMMMPDFWYTAEKEGANKWKIWFADGDPEDGKKWHKWDHGHLIGVYEAYNTGSKVYSISGKNSTGSVTQPDFKQYARNKGDGYMLIDWQAHCIMAFLFYGHYANTDCQAICGSGTSDYKKLTGQTNPLGMTDTTASNGNSMSINFWGLENWWGNKTEWIDNVAIEAGVWKVTEQDGSVRTAGTGGSRDGCITRLQIGDRLDMIPVEANGSDTTGYCDYYYQSKLGYKVLNRAGNNSYTDSGVAYADANDERSDEGPYCGSRLAFIGEIEEADSVSEFLA